jgi:hypothetical protein
VRTAHRGFGAISPGASLSIVANVALGVISLPPKLHRAGGRRK